MKKQSDKNKFVVIIAPIIIILSIVLGLKYFSEKSEQGSITPVVTNEQKDEEIISVDLEGELPRDFPSKFPVFEGAEIEALQGGGETLRDLNPHLAIASYHRRGNTQTHGKVEEILKSQGYDANTFFPPHLTTCAQKRKITI